MVLGRDDWDAKQVASRVVTSAYDYSKFLNPRKLTNATGLLKLRWQRLKPGVMKLNMDGSCITATNLMYTGGILREHSGDWKSSFSSSEGAGGSLLVEILAIKNGLQHTWKMGVQDLMCESDSLDVVSLLTGQGGDISLHTNAGLIENTLVLVAKSWTVQFNHVLREANMCVDYLAKVAAQMHSRWTDWKNPPVLMESFLLHDVLGAFV